MGSEGLEVTRKEAKQAIAEWCRNIGLTWNLGDGIGDGLLDAIGFDQMQRDLEWLDHLLSKFVPGAPIEKGGALVGHQFGEVSQLQARIEELEGVEAVVDEFRALAENLEHGRKDSDNLADMFKERAEKAEAAARELRTMLKIALEGMEHQRKAIVVSGGHCTMNFLESFGEIPETLRETAWLDE